MAYDPVAGLGAVVQVYTVGTQINSTLDGISVDVAHNVLAGVAFDDTPNDLRLYLLSGNASPPALFNQAFFSSLNVNSQLNAATALKAGKAFGLLAGRGGRLHTAEQIHVDLEHLGRHYHEHQPRHLACDQLNSILSAD